MTVPLSPEPTPTAPSEFDVEPLEALAPEEDEQQPAASRWNDNLLWGGLLLLAGVLILLRNLDIISIGLHNWWAVFILVPAVGSLLNGITALRRAGRWTPKVGGSLLGAAVLTLVALTLLLGWRWGRIWPLFLVAGGISALMNGLEEQRATGDDAEQD